jgi:hypothetical protein
MGSGAMIYIPSFVKIRSGIQELMEEGKCTDTQREGDFFFTKKESRLKGN